MMSQIPQPRHPPPLVGLMPILHGGRRSAVGGISRHDRFAAAQSSQTKIINLSLRVSGDGGGAELY